jgi:hypothetical protein
MHAFNWLSDLIRQKRKLKKIADAYDPAAGVTVFIGKNTRHDQKEDEQAIIEFCEPEELFAFLFARLNQSKKAASDSLRSGMVEAERLLEEADKEFQQD